MFPRNWSIKIVRLYEASNINWQTFVFQSIIKTRSKLKSMCDLIVEFAAVTVLLFRTDLRNQIVVANAYIVL